MSNIVYLKKNCFLEGGLLSISIYTKLGVPPQERTDMFKSDEFIKEIIFFSMIFSFWLYIYSEACSQGTSPIFLGRLSLVTASEAQRSPMW